MANVLDELIELLSLERIEENLFRGQSQDLGWGTVFGGQVLGQALSAAVQTVPEERIIHSLHSYFLRPGKVDQPIVYEVDRIRDGKSFTTRRVVAIQNGRAIFNMSTSFQIEEEGFSHQDTMPEVPGPDELYSDQELARLVADQIPDSLKERVLNPQPIEMKQIKPRNIFRPQERPPTHAVWYKTLHTLPDNPSLHRYLLAYASDFHFLTTAMFPHGVSGFSKGMQVASLDHAMWFHRPFRMDEWLLYSIESPSACGARGLVRGRFFTREGKLVATCVQEGLMRKRPKTS